MRIQATWNYPTFLQGNASAGLTEATVRPRNFTGKAVFHRHTAFVVDARGQTEIKRTYTRGG
jgi:hypothetical protein